jgi:hypothetical protein
MTESFFFAACMTAFRCKGFRSPTNPLLYFKLEILNFTKFTAPMRNSVILIFIFFFQTLHAQDTLVRRNGQKIAVKILEVHSEEIRYKRSDSPDGPLYFSKPWELNCIIYAGSRKEDYSSIPLPVVQVKPVDLSIQISGRSYYYKEHQLTENNMLAIAQQRKDKKVDLMIHATSDRKLMQSYFMYGGIVMFGSGLVLQAINPVRRRGRYSPVTNASAATARQNGALLMLGGLGCEAVAIVFKIERTRRAHQVVAFYNQSLLQ